MKMQKPLFVAALNLKQCVNCSLFIVHVWTFNLSGKRQAVFAIPGELSDNIEIQEEIYDI